MPASDPGPSGSASMTPSETEYGNREREGDISKRMSRALVKTLLYRVLTVVITIVVALFVTGDTGDALSIGIASNIIKTGTYYGHERLWDRITWGVSQTDT